jgi:hypothetical protein
MSLELPPDSGLVLVETSRERVTPEAVEDEPQAPRPHRVRPPRAVIADEPLQMVETHKDQLPPA